MARNSECGRPADRKFIPARAEIVRHIRPYRGLFPSPPLFDRMPTYRTQGKRSLNFLSARSDAAPAEDPVRFLDEIPLNIET
jgi:hypothetical protein